MYPDDNQTEDANGSQSPGSPFFESVISNAESHKSSVIERIERLDAGSTDEDAALVRRLKIAQHFDDVHARTETPAPLEGEYVSGAHRYCVGDLDTEAWLTTNHALKLGEMR
ncbi:hypothetical protein [Natrialba sp. SSL1]|uniref:hypothetical protein n=1 Tax=Natrialba sp. SSL1 TaxID=1869245 RepID=UPI0008F9616F|nr:hypothetical protein [Natrialba sp. SSL1]OIB59372.1 hypothetical protein BBD46_01465 [Natrialba sp. SSL1]